LTDIPMPSTRADYEWLRETIRRGFGVVNDTRRAAQMSAARLNGWYDRCKRTDDPYIWIVKRPKHSDVHADLIANKHEFREDEVAAFFQAHAAPGTWGGIGTICVWVRVGTEEAARTAGALRELYEVTARRCESGDLCPYHKRWGLDEQQLAEIEAKLRGDRS
jgi:hypothetical protein